VINVFLDATVAILGAIVLYLSKRYPSFRKFLPLNLLLVVSRVIFIASCILILRSQYEHYARFALSLAQSGLGAAIAVVIICIINRRYWYRDQNFVLETTFTCEDRMISSLGGSLNEEFHLFLIDGSLNEESHPFPIQRKLSLKDLKVITKTTEQDDKTTAYVYIQDVENELGEIEKNSDGKYPNVKIKVESQSEIETDIEVLVDDQLLKVLGLTFQQQAVTIATRIERKFDKMYAKIVVMGQDQKILHDLKVKIPPKDTSVAMSKSRNFDSSSSGKRTIKLARPKPKMNIPSNRLDFMKWKKCMIGSDFYKPNKL
jgi:hypothetical protein